MNRGSHRIVALVFFVSLFSIARAQVNTVEFGKNRVQYQKFKWRYYQTENFSTYFSQDGLELGKYVAQVAERELPQMEEFIEYGLQRRANIVVYNNFDEMYQSNIGLGIDWQGTGGVTKLVNNKMIIYFDANKENLRRQIRQGIANILVANILFGDDLGEFAANQTLLDLPKWLTDGYIDYAAEEWSTKLDNDLKNELLGSDYKNFYQFAFKKPLLAGHAFWYYVGNKYGRQKTTYLLYLARIYRNLNSATQKIAKKKFKDVLKDFMNEVPEMYLKDLRGRKAAPKGTVTVAEDVTDRKDFIRFNANPAPKSFSYAVVEFKQGKYSIVLHENFVDKKVLVSYGARTREDEISPNLPIMAWDGTGNRLAVVYREAGKLKFFVYDMQNRIIRDKQEWTQFNEVQDMKYMLDPNTILLSAVRGGQSDIFVYKIDKMKTEQITNDVYDDLDPSFVAFFGKTGILFSSNRPSGLAPNSDTAITPRNYNIFLIDNYEADYKYISQLTFLGFGNARYPSQYQLAHFTFVSDENGIQNRYAGFFKMERAGLDTLVYVGDQVLHNPSRKEVDSTLKDWNKDDIDSIRFLSVTADSAYVFPLTNYQASMLETRTAGDNSQVSEVVRQGDTKFLYRVKVDETALKRRNVTARPTDYRKKIEERRRMELSKLMTEQPLPGDTTRKQPSDFFNSEFGNEKKDTSQLGKVLTGKEAGNEAVLSRAKLYEYRPRKFFNDYVVAGLNNQQYAINRYQPYQGGVGPIDPSNGNDINGLIRMGTVDLFEDIKLSGGFRVAPNLRDNDVLFEFTDLKKRLDWGFTYYRSNVQTEIDTSQFTSGPVIVNQHSNYYLAHLRYAFDRVRSLRLTVGPRFDRSVFPGYNVRNLKAADIKKTYSQVTLEYVHDNTLNPAQNIWQGLRYRLYIDWYNQLNNPTPSQSKYFYNFGFDVRHYLPLYRNLIWAVRAAGDFSWGTQKVVYYLGGVDGWIKFGDNQKINQQTGQITYRYFDPYNAPDPDASYAYQALALNLRGFKQNVANGNNALVFNSEVRFPVFATLLNRPINNALLRNFQLVQFVDLGSAWNGAYDKWARPTTIYYDPAAASGVFVKLKAGGIGPFAGGYGFGARSTLLGYFIRFDAAWQMDGIFKGKPQLYLALGLDF